MLHKMLPQYILIVEDDDVYCDRLVDLLTKKNYITLVASEGQSALDTLQKRRGAVDLVLLDLELGDPLLDGLAVCKEIREHAPALPIIMLSVYGSDPNRRAALRMGADVFFKKGEDEGVLLDQIARLIDRQAPAPLPGRDMPIGRGFIIHPSQHRLTHNGEEVPLSDTIFRLLFVLAFTPGVLIRNEQLFSKVWDWTTSSSEVLRTSIKRLRDVLGDDASAPFFIFNHPGQGYRFRDWRQDQ